MGVCIKDDITIFKPNGTLELNEGAAKYDPTDPQIFNSTRGFTANETKLVIEGTEFILAELSASTLKITYTGGGINYDDEATYGH